MTSHSYNMSTTPQRPYVKPSELKVSTYTMVCNINSKIDLHILSRCIPIYEDKHPLTLTENGTFISISTYSASSMTDMPRGKFPPKNVPKRVFNNEITLLYKYHGFKHINLKIFTNGMLQMTGIIDPQWESAHISSILVNTFKSLKYRVYITIPANKTEINHFDFITCWNPLTNKVEYYRRNISSYSPECILSHGLLYNFNNLEWDNQETTKIKLNTFISKAEQELTELETLRMELLNTYDFTEVIRTTLYTRANKFEKIKKIDKKILDYDNQRFRDYIIDFVSNIIKFYKSYKVRITQLIITDETFTNTITTQYGPHIKNIIDNGIISNPSNSNIIELDTCISSSQTYNLSNVTIELINSDYNNRFLNNLIKIHELLNGPEYNIYNYYKPDAKYAGIIAKFMYNPAYLDTSKYKLGKCYCPKSCVTNIEPVCIPISISIFRPGSIIITSAKHIKHLVCVYNFLNKFFKDNFNTISYTDIHDTRDHFLLNEERRITRKETLVYIKRDKIIYPAANTPP